MEKAKILKKISFYKYLYSNSLCPLQESYYENLINKEEENLRRLDTQFTLEDLAEYNGSGGKKAYAAVDGIVYDISNVAVWGGGTHFGYTAGKDLTGEFNACHKKDVLDNIPKVGTLIK